MFKKTIMDFKRYLADTSLKQYEAAEKLGIEKGHLNRILTGKRNLTPQMAVEMRRLMGEKDIMSLEECMSKYPIGAKNIFTDLKEIYHPYSEGYPREIWKENLPLDGTCLYKLLPEKGGFTYNFLIQKRGERDFHLVNVWGCDVIFYYTPDGITYRPFWDYEKEDYHSQEGKLFNNIINKNFSNLREIIFKEVENFDKNFGTETIVFPTYKDFINQEV